MARRKKRKESKPAPPIAHHAKPRARSWLAPALIAAITFFAHCNSLQGPMLADDIDSIHQNPDFGGVPSGRTPELAAQSTPPTANTLTGRPILWLSFQFNYLLAGQSVWLMHATNLLIHIAAALVLFGIIRRNLSRTEFWKDRFTDQSAMWLAATIAALWAADPLQTESVSYIIQRAESLAGLFYLLVIYCLIRAESSKKNQPMWSIACVLACALGVATKESVATAPLLALLYDRTFLAGSFAASLRLRWKLFAGLAATWLILAAVIAAGGNRNSTVGFNLGLSSLDYARTELNVIARYLRLVIWPSPLIFDPCSWPIAYHWSDISLGGWLVATFTIASLLALWRWPLYGFIFAWFLFILGPSSTFVPIISEIYAEHRLYLPLAAPIAVAVIAFWIGATRLGKPVRQFAIGCALAAVVVLVSLTIRRNMDYQDAQKFWHDALAKNPSSWLNHFALANVLADECWTHPPRSAEAAAAATAAAAEYRQVLHFQPRFYPAAEALGHMLIEMGDLPAAEDQWSDNIQRDPEIRWDSYMMRGAVRAALQKFELAKTDYQTAVSLRPDDAYAHYMLAIVLEPLHDFDGARGELVRALQLDPNLPDAANELSQLNSQRQ